MLRRSLLKSIIVAPAIPFDVLSSFNVSGVFSFAEFVDFIVDNFNEFSTEELDFLFLKYKEVINNSSNPEELALASWVKIFNLGNDEKGFCISIAQFIAPLLVHFFHEVRPDFLTCDKNDELKILISDFEKKSHDVAVTM